LDGDSQDDVTDNVTGKSGIVQGSY